MYGWNGQSSGLPQHKSQQALKDYGKAAFANAMSAQSLPQVQFGFQDGANLSQQLQQKFVKVLPNAQPNKLGQPMMRHAMQDGMNQGGSAYSYSELGHYPKRQNAKNNNHIENLHHLYSKPKTAGQGQQSSHS